MRINMGYADRALRILIALIIGILLITGEITASFLIIPLAIVASIFLLTGVIGFCPLYALFHVRTNKMI